METVIAGRHNGLIRKLRRISAPWQIQRFSWEVWLSLLAAVPAWEVMNSGRQAVPLRKPIC